MKPKPFGGQKDRCKSRLYPLSRVLFRGGGRYVVSLGGRKDSRQAHPPLEDR
jgi:hypothetical protein